MRTGLNEADLSLEVTTVAGAYTIYQDRNFGITVTNTGPKTAKDITVAAGLPDGMVYTADQATKGAYNLFFETWSIDSLAAGESASLQLTLFPLVGDRPLTFFSQIMTSSMPDPDSTPGNDTDQTDNEDDESAITLSNQPLPPTGGTTADLELTVGSTDTDYKTFEDITFQVMLVNKGPDAAAGVKVAIPFPQGLVYTSQSTSGQAYNYVDGTWDIPLLASGDTARLELVLFPLISNQNITFFAQVWASDQADPDSSPGNNTGTTPVEDDEAAVVISPATAAVPLVQGLSPASSLVDGRIFPVPARDEVNIQLSSTMDQTVEFRIISLDGKQALRKEVQLMKGENRFQLETGQLVPGVYQIVAPQTGQQWKMVKQ